MKAGGGNGDKILYLIYEYIWRDDVADGRYMMLKRVTE